MANTLDVINRRRSVRDFTGEPIAEDVLQKILHAAMQGPSCRNKRTDTYVVITSNAGRAALSKAHPYWGLCEDAGAAVVLCGKPGAFMDIERDYWLEDTSAAMENLLLAAEDQELGAVWLGVYPLEDRMDVLRRLLGIPKDVYPMAIAAIGKPSYHPGPINRFDPKKIHKERW